MLKKMLPLFLITLFFLSCASTEFLRPKAKATMYQGVYPAKNENELIDVYRLKTPEKQYIEIAELSCPDADENRAIKQIIIKAREIGADGIIIIGKAGSYGIGVPIGNMIYASTEAYGMSAVAIKYIVEQ
jgi:hypothetical protein